MERKTDANRIKGDEIGQSIKNKTKQNVPHHISSRPRRDRSLGRTAAGRGQGRHKP